MLVRRFSLAKEVDSPIHTPALLRCGEDVRLEDGEFHFLGNSFRKDVLYPPSLKQREFLLGDVVLVPNINDLLRNTREFVDYTLRIREKYGFSSLFYAPGVPANLIPVLFYLGYDIFDDCLERIRCHELWGASDDCPEGNAERIFDMTLRAFRSGFLREFVESIPDNKAQEIVRYLDIKYYEKVEMFYPIHHRKLNAVSLNSLHRPDVVRWRKRLRDRYSPPRYAKHLLLIPCSARKPYSESKSHKVMRRYIKGTMHEVILTSPLGIVPRELERFYPAAHYDIPVIGHWYEEEKRMISDMLEWYLEKFEYESIISFLPESMRFLEPILKERGATMIWGNDLESLARETRKVDYRVSQREVLKGNIESMARFQFGIHFDLSDAGIFGRFPRVEVKVGNSRLFGYDIHRGMLTLTESSAEQLLSSRRYVVWIDDFYPEGDVFAAGVLDATPDIRVGDEVVVAFDKELRAWGTARMNHYDMRYEKRGKAIKIRGRNQ